jgi:hypothetical protein
MQLSPHHAGLAGLQIQHLRSASRFSAMLLSPSPSLKTIVHTWWDRMESQSVTGWSFDACI